MGSVLVYHAWAHHCQACQSHRGYIRQCFGQRHGAFIKFIVALTGLPRVDALKLATFWVQVLQGMIFVWGRSGPSAVADAAANPPLGIPDMEMTEGLPLSTVQGVQTMAFNPVSL